MCPRDFLVRPDMLNICTKFRFSMSICGKGLDFFDFAGGTRDFAILPCTLHTIKYKIFRWVWLACKLW